MKGNSHTFLEINISYLNNKKLVINMKEYIPKDVQEFGDDVLQMVTSPSARCLFAVGKVRELQGRRLDTFHYVVMQFLWIVYRGRPYFAIDISYLCIRMKHPDISYWNKLKRVLCFVNSKIENKRITGANNLHEMEKCANSYHAVHMVMRGNTGG